MKKSLLSVITGFTIVAYQSVFPITQTFAQPTHRGCGTMPRKEREEKIDPSIKARREQIREEVRVFTENYMKNPAAQKSAVITIPVVFHVIYNGTAENVSDACIQAQLNVINQDFRKQNSDWTKVTQTGWNALVADCEIEFCFAVRDPNNNPTTGITRTSTTAADFDDTDKMKYTAQGGKDVWDRDKYFNIWVCDLQDPLLGYAQFPGGAAATDGLVIDYEYMVGSAGCGTAPFDKGRTSTHELGHCLGLYHIWGDEPACAQDDDITDTPKQADASGGCFTAGQVKTDACATAAPGYMWMNYMDYTDDACMYMFTTGQKTAMAAIMNGDRASLKTSNGCTPLTGVEYMLASTSLSVYPNPSAGDVVMKVSLPGVSSAAFTIYNALGKTVLVKQADDFSTGSEVKLDMSDMPEGIYFVKMQAPQGSVVKKIVITR